jgi:hypothetical protein
VAGDAGHLPSDDVADQLAKLYADAQRDIAARIIRAALVGDLYDQQRRVAQLREILGLLERLGVEAEPVARALVAQAALDGADHVVPSMARIGVHLTEPGEQAFTAVNEPAVRRMQDAILGRLDTARGTVGRQVQDVFAREGREQTMRALLGADGSPTTAARRMANRLAAEGQTALIDAGGRRWSLERYSNMAIRTTTREAVVQSGVNRMVAHDITLGRISAHPNPCKICGPYQNRYVALTGDAPTSYLGEPVMTAGILPPYHPHCRHTCQAAVTRFDALRAASAA